MSGLTRKPQSPIIFGKRSQGVQPSQSGTKFLTSRELAIKEAAGREAKLLNKNRKGTILTIPQPTGF